LCLFVVYCATTYFKGRRELTIFQKSWYGVLTGAIATAGVLLAGLVSFKQGNFNRSQMFMRARVGFQAATVALMVGTVYVEGMGKS
jgi:hypothetical protein